MGHKVDFPDALPVAVGSFNTASQSDAGVGAEQINVLEGGDDSSDEAIDFRFHANIGGNGQAANFSGHRVRTGSVEVGHHHGACALRGKTPAEGPADAVGS